MAAANNDRELLGKLSDLSKVEESSIVRALNEQKAQAENDRESAENSYKEVQEKIETKEEAKQKLEEDIEKLTGMLDETLFTSYEESLAVLGLSESLKKVFDQLKKAPETVERMLDELTKLRSEEDGFDAARKEADIKVSEIENSLPSVISDLEGMAAFLESARSNETGNITKNEIIGRLENINKNCPAAFSASDMDRIAQLILFPDKLIEYFKTHQETETTSKGVGEVIANAMEQSNASEAKAPAVEDEDEMLNEIIAAGYSLSDFTEEDIQVMRENYKSGIIQANLQVLRDNLMDFELGMPAEILVLENLNEKISTILSKGKTIVDIKSSIAVLLLPLETIKSTDLTNIPLWAATNPLALPTAQANEETLLNYGVVIDDEDRKKYYSLMSIIPNQDFEENVKLLREYDIGIIKKNKKPAIRILAQPTASLLSKIDAFIENGRIDEMKASPEVLAGEIVAESLKVSDVVTDDIVATYETTPVNPKMEDLDLETQVRYSEMKNHLLDYVLMGQIEVDDDSYHVNGQMLSRKRIERNLLRAVIAGAEENVALQIALSDGACTTPEALQEIFSMMNINVQPTEGFTQGGVQ